MAARGPKANTMLTRITAPTLPPAATSLPAPPPVKSNAGRWIGVGAFGILCVVVGRCSSSSTTPADATKAAAGVAQQAIVSAVSAQTLPPVEPLSNKGIGRGLSHAKLAAREGMAGKMIYSQNCYDALGRHFTWAKLDACGAFDAEALLSGDETVALGEEQESNWFESEAAAGRFLKAATAGGQTADAADMRWSNIQARSSRQHPPVKASTLDDGDVNLQNSVGEPARDEEAVMNGIHV